MKVYIITCCRTLDALDLCSLTLKSVRVGFPTAKIFIWDNGSIDEAVTKIKTECDTAGFTFWQQPRHRHADVIRHILHALNDATEEPIAILDPDLIFWENMELYQPDTKALFAGRWIQQHFCPVLQARQIDRLHTSFLWIPSPKNLVEAVTLASDPDETNVPVDLYTPRMNFFGGGKIFYDTCCNLYHALGGEAFADDILDRYDHLFVGTAMDLFKQRVEATGNPDLKALYDRRVEIGIAALTAPNSLRGLWRSQDAYYAAHNPFKA